LCLEEHLPQVAFDKHTDDYLDIIVRKFRDIKSFGILIQAINTDRAENVTVTGLAGSSPAILLANLAEIVDRPLIAVSTTPDEAGDFYDDLAYVSG
jgi:hypothetical protein